MQHHKYNLHDIEKMIPWERTVYTTLLINYVDAENEKLKQQKLAQR